MKLLVAGYSQDETHRVSAELRSAGHQVLGALGRSGARTFVKVVTPDLVVVPTAEVDTVRGWITDLGVDLAWVLVDPGADAVRAVAGQAAVTHFDQPPAKRDDDRGPAKRDTAAGTSKRGGDVSFEPPSAARGWAAALRPKTNPTALDPDFSYFEGVPKHDPDKDIDLLAGLTVEPPPLPLATPRPSPPPVVPPAARPSDAPASEAPAAPAPPPSDLVSKLAQTRFGDYHSLLEVEPGASPYAVREQFTRLSRLYSPRGWPRKLGPEELEMLQEVASGIRDAFLILGDPELRARYERALLGGAGSNPSGRS
ncbi:MAG: hypothetical protein CVU56_11440 [Deltaproteobacteria bacterium HGW-Deltaproteobacteria-14]|nr:MAG: hypothetical protein CVU56_11440 [Deltaproteobacteria bacterium HGW-Deltaproteobacteria-14]